MRLPGYLLVTALLAPPAIADEGPLERLAARVPVSAGGMVVLSDVAASRAANAPLSGAFDAVGASLMPYATLTLIDGFDLFASFEVVTGGGLPAALGFGIGDVGQIASWTDGPDAPVILTGLGDRADAIAAAFEEAGLGMSTGAGLMAWDDLPDFAADPARTRADPFSQAPGHARRFALEDGVLIFARGWEALGEMLARGPAISGDPDVAAILRAAYLTEGRGHVVEAIVLGPQVQRAAAVRAFVGRGPTAAAEADAILARPGFDLPPLPAYDRHALVLWQDGLTISGAVAIPYPDRATARTALDRYPRLATDTVSLLARQDFDALLGFRWRHEIVETGGRAILFLGFEETRPAEDASPFMFVDNPYDRLRDMLFAGDLPVLIGGD